MPSFSAVSQLGLPYVKDGSLEYGPQQKFTTAATVSDTETVAYVTALQQPIPAQTLQEVNATAAAVTITTRVPVTVTAYYACNNVETKQTFALIKTAGTVIESAGQLKVTYGKQFPANTP